MTESDKIRTLRRGQVVTVAAGGDYGKPRPAVVVQSDIFPDTHPSVIVCQMTSIIGNASDFRLLVEPSDLNGLRRTSRIMVDKPITVLRARVGRSIGHLDAATIERPNGALAFVLGLEGD